MKLPFLFFGNRPDDKWQLARQMGIKFAIAKLAPKLTGIDRGDGFHSRSNYSIYDRYIFS